MSSNRSQSLSNSCLVSSLIFLSLRSTFLWASTSTGDLMKLLADVKMLCKSVSMSILAISVTGHCDCAGIQFLGEVSICSISKTSASVSSFSANATTWFSGNSKYWLLLRFTIVTCCYYSSIPVTNEPHLASRESKSCLISGGNSS